MPSEDAWLEVFADSLRKYALVLGGELKETDPDAEERAFYYQRFPTRGLICPDCWVRRGLASSMRQKRWLIGCDEHEYRVPPPTPRT